MTPQEQDEADEAAALKWVRDTGPRRVVLAELEDGARTLKQLEAVASDAATTLAGLTEFGAVRPAPGYTRPRYSLTFRGRRVAKALRGCMRCGRAPAYPGAVFCGAGCCARWEAGDHE